MSFENSESVNLSERDQRIAQELEAKLEELKGFEPSGDIFEDFNRLLELTGRGNLYKKVEKDTPPQVVLAGLVGVKATWESILKNPEEVGTDNLAKKLFYVDIPQEEIRVVNGLISYYIENLEETSVTDEFDQLET